MEIIPAIDLMDGKCVRLSKGDFATRKIYHEDPVAVALGFEQAGIKRLHLVDLDGARSGHLINQNILAKIAARTELAIDFSGGIRSDGDIHLAFALGAKQVCCGSIAIDAEAQFLSWLAEYGSDRIILAADVLEERVSSHGWQENSGVDIMTFISRFFDFGIRRFICTDISKDGLLHGPSLALYKKIIATFPEISLIASGGIADMNDVQKLAKLGCFGAIIGRALYEGKIEISELAKLAC